MIESDQYKYDACSITNDECCGGSCEECEVAEADRFVSKKQLEQEEIERYTKFERSSKLSGHKVMVEAGNVIAKTDLETLRQLQEITELFKKTTIPYHPDNLKQYATHLRKLRQYNGLGIPDMIWGEKNCPAAFLFGDVVYLIAPRIEG